jgi:hypothetical protein
VRSENLKCVVVALASFATGWGVCFAALRLNEPARDRQMALSAPRSQSLLLDPSGFLPSEGESLSPPKTDPRDVVLRVENRTGGPLHLVMYDCWAHYRPELPYQSLRRHGPLRAGPEIQEYDQFETGSGWFVFLVADDPVAHLVTANNFQGPRPLLIIERKGGLLAATLRFPEELGIDDNRSTLAP